METDAELHVFRLAELARVVAGGELYPRWAPNFYFGYGYPIFNYYAPLSYYLGLPLALLPGLGAILATKFVFVLTYLLGATGIYGFVSDWWGRKAGLVATASYLFAPYLHYVDPHARGDLAEFVSFGFFPLALWAFSRLLQRRSARAFAAASVLTAAVILAHNLMALVFFAVLGAWVTWQALFAQQSGELAWWADMRTWLKERGLWLFLALFGGILLSAFFWLPVALEQDAVNLSTLIGDGSHFDFRNHFLSLRDLFGPTAWLDWGATEPKFTLNLGMLQWLLALLGIGGILTGFARHRKQALFFAAGALALIFLMTRPSTVIWQTVPMMPYLQFPWRLLGPSAAFLAVLGGMGIQSVDDCLRRMSGQSKAENTFADVRYVGLLSWIGPLVPAFAILLILLQSIPTGLVPPWNNGNWDTSEAAVATIERHGRWLGTTSTADFVPHTVEVAPQPQSEILQQLLTGEPLDRVNRATLPETASVSSQNITPLHTRYQTSSPTPFLLRLFLYDFPGWQARIDGAIAQKSLGRPEGFLIVPVPAGEHTVDVQFVNTPVRWSGWALALLGLLLTLLISVHLKRKPVTGHAQTVNSEGRAARLATRTVASLFIAFVIFALVSGLAHRYEWLHYRSTGQIAIPAQNDRVADLGGQLSLIGFDAPDMVRPGDTIEVTLYWKAQEEMDINFQVFVHLLDSTAMPVAQSDRLNPGDFPTRRWPTGKYVRDSHRLEIPDTLEPGRYLLSTGMWVQAEGWRLPLLDDEGQQIGDSIPLIEIEVR